MRDADSPMRLLHVVPTYLPATRYGGPIYSVHGLCVALASRGHEVHVFTTNVDGPGNSPVPLDRPVDLDGVQVSYFPSPLVRRLYWSPAMARALRQQVASFDLLHSHSVFLWPTWAAARAARSAGVPYIVSPRGMLVKELFSARSRLAKSSWMFLVERQNLESAAGIHVTSTIERNELKNFVSNMRGRVFQVPNGVDAPTPLPIAPSREQSYVLMLGRISWKKRIETALEALARVDDIRLVVAGGDDEGLSRSLLDRAATLGVANRVDFMGPVHGLEKRKVLRDALALLMPSFSENFGNSALEAMAEGTPPIVVPQVGMAEIIEKTSAGFVVQGTAEAFADAIRTLQGDPLLRAQMSRRALDVVAAEYSWPVIGGRIDAEYRTILKESHAH